MASGGGGGRAGGGWRWTAAGGVGSEHRHTSPSPPPPRESIVVYRAPNTRADSLARPAPCSCRTPAVSLPARPRLSFSLPRVPARPWLSLSLLRVPLPGLGCIVLPLDPLPVPGCLPLCPMSPCQTPAVSLPAPCPPAGPRLSPSLPHVPLPDPGCLSLSGPACLSPCHVSLPDPGCLFPYRAPAVSFPAGPRLSPSPSRVPLSQAEFPCPRPCPPHPVCVHP